jgi:hypothetical protein
LQRNIFIIISAKHLASSGHRGNGTGFANAACNPYLIFVCCKSHQESQLWGLQVALFIILPRASLLPLSHGPIHFPLPWVPRGVFSFSCNALVCKGGSVGQTASPVLRPPASSCSGGHVGYRLRWRRQSRSLNLAFCGRTFSAANAPKKKTHCVLFSTLKYKAMQRAPAIQRPKVNTAPTN